MDEQIEKRFTNTARSETFKNILRELSLSSRSVLDIGCCYGEHLAHFGKDSLGISINQEEVEYGTKRGLTIRYGNIESPDFDLDSTFQVIFANNIFEHLYSPHRFLCEIKKYLQPNGILILGVPCIPKIVSLLRIRKFQGSLSDAHINFFTRDTLIKTAERAGWKPITTRGFHFSSPLIDHLLDPIYPHLYVIAKLDPAFAYSEKRLKELAGYEDLPSAH